MLSRRMWRSMAVVGVVGLGWMTATWVGSEPLFRGVSGPDVIVGELPAVQYWGRTDEIAAFSVATTSCNVGDTPLNWYADDTRHPVIAQNMYRYSNGRFTQIGQSWLKHGFAALAQNDCGLGCQNPNDSQLLGVGCSDPYTAGLNGNQLGLGPRFEVNATSGAYSYPFSGQNQTGDVIFKRLQVPVASLLEDDNARYFVEAHYIASDDAAAGNGLNNASYREVSVSPNFTVVPTAFSVSTVGPTQRTSPALQAWKDIDGAVQLESVDVPSDGRFLVASKAIALGGGQWRYELAVQNLNSHRSASAFSIPLPSGTTVSDVGFHRAAYHSGEPYDEGAWPSKVSTTSLTWDTSSLFADGFENGTIDAWQLVPTNPPSGSFEETSNALRWGTTYNFWFTCDRAPTAAIATLTLMRSGTPATVTADIQGPG